MLFSPTNTVTAFLTKKCELRLSNNCNYSDSVIVPGFKSAWLLSFSDDGNKIAGLSGDNILYVFNIDSKKIIKIKVKGISMVGNIAFSKSGEYIFVKSEMVESSRGNYTKILIINLSNGSSRIEKIDRAYNMEIIKGYRDIAFVCRKRIKITDKFFQPQYYALYDWSEEQEKLILRYEIAPQNNWGDDFELILDKGNGLYVSLVNQKIVCHAQERMFDYEVILDTDMFLSKFEKIWSVTYVDNNENILICIIEDVSESQYSLMMLDYQSGNVISKVYLNGFPDYISLSKDRKRLSYTVWNNPSDYCVYMLS